MKHSESGVAIWYILAGIALFAALSFSFMRSVSQSSTGATKEQARITANEILRYAKSIEQGVNRLRLVNGCGENEISFYSPKWATPADYDNTNSLFANGDFNCHVFHRDGAGVNWQQSNANDYFFTGRLKVNEVGTGNTDLVMLVNDIPLNLCNAINQNLGLSATSPPQDALNSRHFDLTFTGTYVVSTDQINGGDLDGISTACYEGGGDPAPGTYHFYHVLIDR